MPFSRATTSFVVSRRCSLIIAFVAASFHARGFALLRKAAIESAFASQRACASAVFASSPAFAAAIRSAAIRMCCLRSCVNWVPPRFRRTA